MTRAADSLFMVAVLLAVFLPMFFVRLGRIAAAIEALAPDAPKEPSK